jgi:hypothetical protein
MVRYEPKVASIAAPRMCAEECQKTVFASASSYLRRVRVQSPAKGLFKSHNSPVFSAWESLSLDAMQMQMNDGSDQ